MPLPLVVPVARNAFGPVRVTVVPDTPEPPAVRVTWTEPVASVREAFVVEPEVTVRPDCEAVAAPRAAATA